MKIIISPTKTMRELTPNPKSVPKFLEQAKYLVQKLRMLPASEIQEKMKLSDALQEQVLSDLANWRTDGKLEALTAFDGLSYKRLDVSSLHNTARAYLDSNCRILSGLYGVLRPTDGICRYRLDFLMPFGLYDFWGDQLAKELGEEEIIDLCSEEFSKAIRPYVGANRYRQIKFWTMRSGKWKSLATPNKEMRGLFLREMAQRQIRDISELFELCVNGYRYDPETSTQTTLHFRQVVTD